MVFQQIGHKIRLSRAKEDRTWCSPIKVRTTALPETVGFGLRSLKIETERRHRIEDWFLGLEARRKGLAGANVVLNTIGNGGITFLRWAKMQDAMIVSDIVITPRALEILAEERERWPTWEISRDMRKAIAIDRKHMEDIVSVSDLLLCPSERVLQDLSCIHGFALKKAITIPYALGTTRPMPISSNPVKKRVLFAGDVGLRKGLPYLAEAARLLRRRDQDFEIRVAGAVSDTIRTRPECTALTFLGHIGPIEMALEFQRADVFCLPSLAEGMASVTLEALANRVPCVVTQAAGAPIEDGIEGRIVPERNSVELADAIATIANDRDLRQRMSEASGERAGQHTPEVIGDRLCAALANIMPPRTKTHT